MTKRRILLVDDSSTVIAFERALLRGEDLEISVAVNGKAALERAEAERPDLILLDVMMPEMNGIDCCRHLKSKDSTRGIPVIIVTTKGEQSMVSAAFAAGCNDFITKPIDKMELLGKIRGHLAESTGPTGNAAQSRVANEVGTPAGGGDAE